jgi:hypothetical protein
MADDLQRLKDHLRQLIAEQGGGLLQDGECIRCRKPALARYYSAAGRREFAISGLCEICFNVVCAEDDDGGANIE